jgi:hypothetical protein
MNEESQTPNRKPFEPVEQQTNLARFFGTSYRLMRRRKSLMKATNHSSEQKSRKSLYRAAGSSRSETAVFAALGFTGFAGIVVALVSGSVPAGSKEEALAPLGRLPIVKYFSSGRWAADARTAAAMVHYIFENEKPLVTNVIYPSPAQTNLAMPTNNACRDPKA